MCRGADFLNVYLPLNSYWYHTGDFAVKEGNRLSPARFMSASAAIADSLLRRAFGWQTPHAGFAM
jgi:hypothetical protein